MSQFDVFLASKRRAVAERDLGRSVVPDGAPGANEPLVLESGDLSAREASFARRVDGYRLFLLVLLADALLALACVLLERYAEDLTRESRLFADAVAPALGHIWWGLSWARLLACGASVCEALLTLRGAMGGGGGERGLPRLALLVDGALRGALG